MSQRGWRVFVHAYMCVCVCWLVVILLQCGSKDISQGMPMDSVCTLANGVWPAQHEGSSAAIVIPPVEGTFRARRLELSPSSNQPPKMEWFRCTSSVPLPGSLRSAKVLFPAAGNHLCPLGWLIAAGCYGGCAVFIC